MRLKETNHHRRSIKVQGMAECLGGQLAQGIHYWDTYAPVVAKVNVDLSPVAQME